MRISKAGKDGIRINLEWQFRDYECSAKLGAVKDALRTRGPSGRAKTVDVDFGALTWADPIPLLSLGAVLHTVHDYGAKITINLGASSKNLEHQTFLKFLATQGFLTAYGGFATFFSDNQRYSRSNTDDLDLEDLIYEFGRFQPQTNYRNSDCIFAKFIGVNDYRDDPGEHELLHGKVEELVSEANKRAIDSAYSPLLRLG
ncbi:MAG: hypothetical protein ACYCY5_09475 [Sulfuricella sp.]